MGVFGPRWSRQVVFLAAACLVWFIAAPAAGAGTVQSDDTHLSFTAGASEANHLFVFQVPGGYRVFDLGAPVTPATGCSAVSANEVFCTVTFSFDEPVLVDVAAGDLDDFVSVSSGQALATVAGDGGDDYLEVNVTCGEACASLSDPRNLLDGGAGDDTLRSGDAGGYVLDGGAGADDMNGRRFTSTTVDYSTRSNPVTVHPDGVADDGEAGEGDNVGANVITVIGGSGDDHLIGGARTFELAGGKGNDTLSSGEGGSGDVVLLFGGDGDDVLLGGPFFDDLEGGKGNDTLTGGAHGDFLSGGAGDDVLRGDDGRDELYGNRGNDLLVGGLSHDKLFGGADNDTLRARDGVRDSLDGNGGSDRARLDRGLDVVRNVEALF
jgi:Ca2+-binding RTX toxin-like protein